MTLSSREWGQQNFANLQEFYISEGCSERFVKPRFAGLQTDEHGESWRKWAVFPLAAVEAAHGPLTPDTAETIAGNLTGWQRSYHGPGRSFSSEPSIRRIGNRYIAVTCSGGLDI